MKETFKKEKKSKRRRIYEYMPKDDIKYRGPLSYRMLKIVGWIALAFSQYLLLAKIQNNVLKIDEPIAFGNTINGIIVDLALPLLLFGNFALLLNGQNKFRTHFLINGGASLAFIIIYFIVYHRYAIGFASVFCETRNEAVTSVDRLFYLLNASYESFHGFVAFNIFIDMFLCTLGWFFIIYTPKKCFKGKKIYFFRSLVIIPFVYEIVCIALKIKAASYSDELMPVTLFPFLTTKPPLVFILFMALAIYLKIRERKFLKQGKTKEDYQVFLQTNRNSLNIMLFTIVVMLVVIVIDEFLLKNIIVPRIVAYNKGIIPEEYESAYEFLIAPTVSACGIGEMKSMLLFTPLLLLFSYTRTHKHTIIDSAITVLGIGSIGLIYLDGIMGIIKNILIAVKNSGAFEIVANMLFTP